MRITLPVVVRCGVLRPTSRVDASRTILWNGQDARS